MHVRAPRPRSSKKHSSMEDVEEMKGAGRRVLSSLPEAVEAWDMGRKNDRETLCERIFDLSACYNCFVETWDVDARCVSVTFETLRHNLAASFWLDGGAGASRNTHVVSWHMARYPGKGPLSHALSDSFPANHGINLWHRMKATTIAYGAADLLHHLNRCLASVADGTAFIPNPKLGKPEPD